MVHLRNQDFKCCGSPVPHSTPSVRNQWFEFVSNYLCPIRCLPQWWCPACCLCLHFVCLVFFPPFLSLIPFLPLPISHRLSPSTQRPRQSSGPLAQRPAHPANKKGTYSRFSHLFDTAFFTSRSFPRETKVVGFWQSISLLIYALAF